MKHNIVLSLNWFEKAILNYKKIKCLYFFCWVSSVNVSLQEHWLPSTVAIDPLGWLAPLRAFSLFILFICILPDDFLGVEKTC